MKKIIALLVVCLALPLAAEYQVFRYSATIRFPAAGRVGYNPKGVIIKGYLVTVCCYPCGSDFGTAYPSWLYIMRSGDKTRTLWKIPVRVAGGVFGPNLDAAAVHDYYWDNWLNGKKIQYYAGKATKSYAELFFRSTQSNSAGENLLGGRRPRVEITQAGLGSAGVKINRNIEQWLNPYVKTVSGSGTGRMDMDAFGYDPANFNLEDWTTIHGSFSLSFSTSLTELIRGQADWKIIDRLIFAQFKYKELVAEPAAEDFYLHWDD